MQYSEEFCFQSLNMYGKQANITDTCVVRCRTLEWLGPQMTDEIWLKVGGDHGKGSFKLVYQLLHTPHPNTVSNTRVFALMEAKDSRDNLDTALGRYKAEIEALQKETWL